MAKAKRNSSGVSTAVKKRTPKKKKQKLDSEEGELIGAVLNAASDEEIEAGTAGHDMEISLDESEAEE